MWKVIKYKLEEGTLMPATISLALVATIVGFVMVFCGVSLYETVALMTGMALVCAPLMSYRCFAGKNDVRHLHFDNDILSLPASTRDKFLGCIIGGEMPVIAALAVAALTTVVKIAIGNEVPDDTSMTSQDLQGFLCFGFLCLAITGGVISATFCKNKHIRQNLLPLACVVLMLSLKHLKDLPQPAAIAICSACALATIYFFANAYYKFKNYEITED